MFAIQIPTVLTFLKLSAVNYRLGVGHFDGVNQRLEFEVVVDEGGNEADLGQAQPNGHVLGPVLHEDGHAVAACKTLVQEEVSNTVAVFFNLQKRQNLKTWTQIQGEYWMLKTSD